jgi:hypothetical protein
MTDLGSAFTTVDAVILRVGSLILLGISVYKIIKREIRKL